MKFQGKIFKLGNAFGVYIPRKVYTNLTLGAEYEFEVYTNEEKQTPEPEKENVITIKKPRPLYCEKKHKGLCVMAKTCGCYA